MDIRDRVSTDVLDYQQLTSLLRDYAKPRDRISALLAGDNLIRVRKGLYIFGDRYRRGPVQREILANLVYGPSYISLDYALSHYGLIPERVEDVTSMTTGENKRFSTPIGVFTYQHIPLQRYSVGIRWVNDNDQSYLIATPEKALIDKVWTDKRFKPGRLEDYEDYFFADLRLDEGQVMELDAGRMTEIANIFHARKITMLCRFLETYKGNQQ